MTTEEKPVSPAPVKVAAVPQPEPRWNAGELKIAVGKFNSGTPALPVIDVSPNRGTGWMGRR